MPELLSSAHANCVSAFESLIRTLDPKNRGIHDQIMPGDIKRADIKEEFDRYKIWAGSVGATQLGKHDETLLDYRLREASFLKDQTLKLLSTLRDRIATTDKICSKPGSYEEPEEESDSEESTSSNRGVNCEEEENEFEDSPWEISSDSSNDDGSLSKHQLIRDKPQTSSEDSTKAITTSGPSVRYIPMSVSRLVESIRFTVTSLYRLPISDPAPLDRVGYKTSIESDVYQHSDIKYVKSKFPHIQQRVAARLGKMITRRRQILAYREAHRRGLASNIVQAQALSLSENSQASSIETRSNQATLVSSESVKTLVAPSVVSSLSTTVDLHATKDLRIETFLRPKDAGGRKLERFECPYCFQIKDISDDRQWQEHILEDLQPYVCTYDDCDLYDHFFDSRDAWFNHEVHHHRALWFCNTKGHPKFDLEGEFLSHMQEIHEQRIGGMRFSLIKNMFRHPTESLKGTCNLCRRDSEDLKSHLSEHLQRIALFALSRVDETAVQELARRICQAVDDTTMGYGNDKDANAHCFLPRTDLANILNQHALRRLIEELISAPEGFAPTSADEESDSNGDLLTNLDRIVHDYVQRTIGHPPRLALLALFLYDGRPSLQALFLKWLKLPDFPSNLDLPLNDNTLGENNFPDDCHRFILNNQNIFRPVLIRENLHQEFRDWDRLPYIGKPEPIKDGSSGSVYSVKIAKGHWEISPHGRYIPGNPDEPYPVAIKVFREVPGGRSREEATEDFRVERKILDQIRVSKIEHEMVMLDLGSITILDGANQKVSQSLMFKLATFSLAEFLKDERRHAKYSTRSVLFSKLVDISEALAYLHHHLDILHLDIKPDNILVFEKGTSRQDNEDGAGDELVWKLSDFGLARNKGAEARYGLGGRNLGNRESPSSEVETVRHVGPYQPPEVHQRESSGVGRRSDVWSMGCVTLMVLAFITNGVAEVENLWSKLPVDFQQRGGRQRLFYHRSDSYLWGSGKAFRYTYMPDFDPDIGDIPGTSGPLQAAIHPLVISWSNMLHDFFVRPGEKDLVRDILGLIFGRVLLIDRSKRIDANRLAREMEFFQERWKLFEQGMVYPDAIRDISHQTDANRLKAALEGTTEPPRVEKESFHPLNQPTGTLSKTPLTHSGLCHAIISDDDSTVLNELEGDDGMQLLKNKCEFCSIYPIHKALRNRAYKSLKILVSKSDSAVAGLACPESGNQTALELASEGSGDSKALEIFLDHHAIFNVTKEFFNERKGDLNDGSRASLKEMWKRSPTQSGKRGLFKRWI
jgi:serine/threonine protein kinase